MFLPGKGLADLALEVNLTSSFILSVVLKLADRILEQFPLFSITKSKTIY